MTRWRSLDRWAEWDPEVDPGLRRTRDALARRLSEPEAKPPAAPPDPTIEEVRALTAAVRRGDQATIKRLRAVLRTLGRP